LDTLAFLRIFPAKLARQRSHRDKHHPVRRARPPNAKRQSFTVVRIGGRKPGSAGKYHQCFCWLTGPRGRRPSARAARRAVGLNLTKTVHVPLEVGTKGKQRLRATGKPPTWETPYYPLGRAGRIHQLLAALASLSVAAFFGNKISASRSRSGGEGIEGEGLERRGMILHAMG